MAKFKRPDGRAADALRPITIEVGVSKFAEGSARIAFGDTIVLCLATLTDSVPKFLDGRGTGAPGARIRAAMRYCHEARRHQHSPGSVIRRYRIPSSQRRVGSP